MLTYALPRLSCLPSIACVALLAARRLCASVCGYSISAESPCTDSRPHSRQAMFNLIVSRYDAVVSRLCFGYARSREDFEDLRQDAYINIWQGLGRFRGDARITTWIYRITLNTCVSSMRRRPREASIVDIDSIVDMTDTDGQRMELLRELHDAIDTLPALDRAIMLMWLDEMTYDEIAAVVDMERNTVATRLRRAKEKLKIVTS